MCSVFAHEGKLIWGTKMVSQDFHEMVEQFVKLSDIDYEEFCWDVINSGHTPIFEWMHPQKRIVIDYGKEPTLTLTAIRNIYTGEYISRERLVDWGTSNGIPVVRAFDPQTDMKAFIEHVRDLEDLEGFVVRFNDGHMIKLKCDWYIQIHKAKEAILQDRNIVEIILNEKLDDVKAHLPAEDRDRLTLFESNINFDIACRVRLIRMKLNYLSDNGIDRKTFALDEKHSVGVDAYMRPIIFKNFDMIISSDKILEDVRNTIRNNLTKTVKYEAIRDVWFNGVVFNG
jgi:RNA ligase